MEREAAEEVRLGAVRGQSLRWGRWAVLLSAALLLAAAVPGAGLLLGEPPPLAVVRTLGGQRLRVEKVTFGARHEHQPGPLWRQLLPQGARQVLGGESHSFQNARGKSLVVWTRISRLASGSVLVTTLDEAGRPCDQPASVMVMHGSGRGDPYEAYEFTAFPRRGRSVRVRFHQYSGSGKWEPLGEVDLPNPDPGPHPQWTPEPLPQARGKGEITFTLESLRTGLGPLGTDRPAAPGEGPGLRLVFAAAQGRRPAPWEPFSVTVTDATGNQWQNGASARLALGPGRTVYQIEAGLPAGEKAYRLRVGFARKSGFPAEELWTFRGLPLPAPGKTATAEQERRVGGLPLRVRGIAGARARLPGSLAGSSRQWPALHVRFSEPPGLPEEQRPRLTLVRVIDDRDRPVPVRSSSSSSGDHAYELSVARGARAVDATFAVHRPVYVQFLAGVKSR